MRWKKQIKFCAANDPPAAKGVPITLLLSPGTNEYMYMLAEYFIDAAQKAGYKVNYLDSKNNPETQLEQVEEARKDKDKAVILNIADPSDAKRIIDAAGDMKVIFLSRSPADMSLLNKNAVNIGSDQTIAGKLQGEYLANYFKERNKNNIKYLLIQGPPGLIITRQRTESALNALADNGIDATEAAPPIVGNFERVEAQHKMYPVIDSGVKYDAIISNNDAMALGAIDALESRRIDPTRIPIVSIDAIYSALQALREGKLAMTAFPNAKNQSETAITALTNMLKDRPFYEGTGYTVSPNNPYVIYTSFEPVTKTNIPKDLEYTPSMRTTS